MISISSSEVSVVSAIVSKPSETDVMVSLSSSVGSITSAICPTPVVNPSTRTCVPENEMMVYKIHVTIKYDPLFVGRCSRQYHEADPG